MLTVSVAYWGMSQHDPADLEITVRAAGPTTHKWMLTVGNSAPIRSGIVTGTSDDAYRVAQETRLRLISKGKKV
jgi:hypothetical protein